MKRQWAAWVLALLAFNTIPLQAQGTKFTYQGHLRDGANPANGEFDLRFGIWDAASGGISQGDAITNAATDVSNGVFTVALDFGSVFDGSARWLEIGVRTNGGEVFTTLSPRQALTAAPYAIYAGGVNAAGISGTIGSNNLAPGAAAENLAASGQSAVPSGGVVFSSNDNDTNLTTSGYVRVGGYVSAPNLWVQRATNPALAAREGHTAVWTGNKMIVWGGYCGNENPSVPPPITYFHNGGAYDPNSDSWTAISTNGGPLSRKSFSTVWTGSEMIIWSGYTFDTAYHYFDDGARYKPTSNSWATVTTNNAPSPRSKHTAIWTGTEMIVWGGFFGIGAGFQYLVYGDGARYNPISDTWTSVSTNGAPTARFDHTAVWTGSEMVVWGGQNGNGSGLNDGKRYNPQTDTWSPVSSTNSPGGRSVHTAVWTGSEMIVWGGITSDNTSRRYNPTTDTWSEEIDYSSAPSKRVLHTAVWTGREMIVWGGDCSSVSYPPCNDGGSYDPSRNIWTPVTTTPRVPAARRHHTAVWTGSEMIVLDGSSSITGGSCLSDTWSCTPPKLLYLYQRP